ncbi:cytochrome b/b6 domain-containing protein [Pseudomonas fuscovaginae UPB0736]|uniref:cytochrome b/b6 domain-containing protein n=1 Tax=Pseudomonas asplenii TaxID=53407 RepID=UPI00049402B1|nr:cytochrome b/b6 domain-containing protein [Pseudomonas fuscovaginae]UUQ64474.1 cytochrome b/b6 domain-containing protein [Pseudomonas fuscovaginae UPB0736]
MNPTKPEKSVVHPLWLRICHWINVLALTTMIMSGWRIYNASPLFDFTFPRSATLGGWLGGALQWHFAAMWVFGLNGLIYILMNLVTQRFKYRFAPLSVKQFMSDMQAAVKGRLAHADIHQYNMVQKFAYLSVIIMAIALVMSGLVLWKPVQFPTLRELLGGYDVARYIHFYLMAFIVGFIVVHIVMVALVPKTFLAILRGR